MTNLNTLPGFSTGGGGGGTTALASHVDSLILDNNRPNAWTYDYQQGMIAGQCATAGNLKSRNVFARWMQWQDSTNNQTGFTINSFSIDRSTGALTQLQGGPQDVWTNSLGASVSTTYCCYEPMHGCFFSAGNNGYPGYSYHVFGYTAGQLDKLGAVIGGTASYTASDHGQNGTYCSALPQGSGSNYFSSSGYGNGSYAGGRLNEGTATGITVPSAFTNDGTWTSSGSPVQCYYQPDVNTTPTGHVTSMRATSFNSPNYGRMEFRGTVAEAVVREQGYQNGMLMCGHSGTTLLGNVTDFGTPGVTSASFTSLTDGTQDLIPSNFISSSGYGTEVVGIGNNMYLHFGPQVPEKKVELLKVDANNDIVPTALFTLGSSVPSVLDPVSNVTHNFVVFETDTSPYPKWLVRGGVSSNDQLSVQSFELLPDFSTY
jgi:hypothetical protein